jgi:hypothetical protein
MTDFRVPDVYFIMKQGEPILIVKLGRQFEIPTRIVPEGSIVYRADAGGAKSPSANVPAFFSNNTSITVYKRGDEKNVSKYRTTKAMRLFEMTIQNLKTLYAFHPSLTSEDKDFLKLYLSKQTEGAVLPIYPTKDRYLNRTIANLVCRLGVDGWIVQPYQAGTSGMLDYSIVRRNIKPYTPEIMVCKWTDCMVRVTEGGKKRSTRHSSRSNRKQTRRR